MLFCLIPTITSCSDTNLKIEPKSICKRPAITILWTAENHRAFPYQVQSYFFDCHLFCGIPLHSHRKRLCWSYLENVQVHWEAKSYYLMADIEEIFYSSFLLQFRDDLQAVYSGNGGTALVFVSQANFFSDIPRHEYWSFRICPDFDCDGSSKGRIWSHPDRSLMQP